MKDNELMTAPKVTHILVPLNSIKSVLKNDLNYKKVIILQGVSQHVLFDVLFYKKIY